MGLEADETDFYFMKADSKLKGSMINIAKFISLLDYLKIRNYNEKINS
ncbi:MAG: hypothetical protein IKV87_09320 [Methanobrevibacter sp.]|nr:hypothetical protein [Methanobrevibacter sp.]